MEDSLDLLDLLPGSFSTDERDLLEQMYQNAFSDGGNDHGDGAAAEALVSEHNYAISGKSANPSEIISEDVFLPCINSPHELAQSCGSEDGDLWADELLNVPESRDAGLSQSHGADGTFQESASSSPVIPNHHSRRSSTPSPSLLTVVSPNRHTTQTSPVPSDIMSVIDVRSPDSTFESSTGNPRKRRVSGQSSSDAGDTAVASYSKNAIAARENRLKKKKYVENLEKQNKRLEAENSRIKKEAEEREERLRELEERNAYLNNVLHNQSALSSLLGSISPVSEVRLSIARQGGKRRKRGGGHNEVIPMSKGVCLHVDGQTASLELCSQCAIMAKGGST